MPEVSDQEKDKCFYMLAVVENQSEVLASQISSHPTNSHLERCSEWDELKLM